MLPSLIIVGESNISLFFLTRESEAIIPSIFFFLVLLSYERYHSKQIIGIPKIIRLCDGIMASGRKAVTHGNRPQLVSTHICAE